jgi:hypothetical protein
MASALSRPRNNLGDKISIHVPGAPPRFLHLYQRLSCEKDVGWLNKLFISQTRLKLKSPEIREEANVDIKIVMMRPRLSWDSQLKTLSTVALRCIRYGIIGPAVKNIFMRPYN